MIGVKTFEIIVQRVLIMKVQEQLPQVAKTSHLAANAHITWQCHPGHPTSTRTRAFTSHTKSRGRFFAGRIFVCDLGELPWHGFAWATSQAHPRQGVRQRATKLLAALLSRVLHKLHSSSLSR